MHINISVKLYIKYIVYMKYIEYKDYIEYIKKYIEYTYVHESI